MKDWERKYYSESDGRPNLFYVLYGSFGEMQPLSRSIYWSNGVPSGFELMKYERLEQPDVFNTFCEGYLWETLQKEDPEQAGMIESAESCFILRGEVEDQLNLNYFRDVIGVLTYLADFGGVSIFDPHMFKWWRVDEWKSKVFEGHEAYPRHHVVVLSSDEPDGLGSIPEECGNSVDPISAYRRYCQILRIVSSKCSTDSSNFRLLVGSLKKA